MAKKQDEYKPGQIAQTSGIYEAFGPRGGDLKIQVTVTKKEPFPPASKPGVTYKLFEKTKHKRT